MSSDGRAATGTCCEHGRKEGATGFSAGVIVAVVTVGGRWAQVVTGSVDRREVFTVVRGGGVATEEAVEVTKVEICQVVGAENVEAVTIGAPIWACVVVGGIRV